MKPNKSRKAAFLFSEMGGIDDYLLQEALIYRPTQARASGAWIVAACLAMSLMIVLGVVMIGNLAGIKNENPQINEELSPSPASTTLDEFLIAHGAEIAHTTVTEKEQLDLFAAPVVVWQSTADGELFVSRPLTDGEIKQLTSRAGNGTDVGEKAPSQVYHVWILTGDGTVTTPYLKASVGNIGTTLFDYEAEIIPTDEFTSCLKEILYS